MNEAPIQSGHTMIWQFFLLHFGNLLLNDMLKAGVCARTVWTFSMYELFC